VFVSLASTSRWALLAILLTIPWSGRAEPEGEIAVVVKGLRNSEGKLLAQLFRSPAGFPSGRKHACQAMQLSLEAGSPHVVFAGLPFGEYAVTLCHDENGNIECDVNLLGIPKEGVGISNGVRRRLGPPRFDDAKFPVDSPRKRIEIEIRY
jgi:uncharacterized protein (DUF2141 family)